MISTTLGGGLRLPFPFLRATESTEGVRLGRISSGYRPKGLGYLCTNLGHSEYTNRPGELSKLAGCWVIGMSNGEGGTGESCATPSCHPQ